MDVEMVGAGLRGALAVPTCCAAEVEIVKGEVVDVDSPSMVAAIRGLEVDIDDTGDSWLGEDEEGETGRE